MRVPEDRAEAREQAIAALRILLVCLAALVLCAVAAAPAHADTWAPATRITATSADGEWRITIDPRDLSSNLDYFRDSVDGRERPGGLPSSTQDSATAAMEHRRGTRWTPAWRGPLVNDVSPVHVLVANDGRMVTFDNWHSVGHGDDAIALYAADGRLVRAFGLEDFLPADYVRALPHSVSSLRWRGEARIDDRAGEIVVPVRVPSHRDVDDDEGEGGDHVEWRIDLATGDARVVDAAAWRDAQSRATRAAAAEAKREAEWRATRVAPLVAPRDLDHLRWASWLSEAYERLTGDTTRFPRALVLSPRDALVADWSARLLADTLSGHSPADEVLLLTATPQAHLATALRAQQGKMKPGALEGTRLYVGVGTRHFAEVTDLLATSGATLIQIDPAVPIPQRPERIADLDRRVESEAAARAAERDAKKVRKQAGSVD